MNSTGWVYVVGCHQIVRKRIIHERIVRERIVRVQTHFIKLKRAKMTSMTRIETSKYDASSLF